MRQYSDPSITTWEQGYAFRIRVAILTAILAHIVILYCWMKPHQVKPKWSGIPIKNDLIVHTLPPREPTPEPKKTPPPTRNTGRQAVPRPPRKPIVKPIPVPEKLEIDLSKMMIDSDFEPEEIDFPEPDPPENLPYNLNHPAIVRPRCIRQVPPKHPRAVERMGLRGVSVIRCVIECDGIPSELEVIQSFNSLCDQAAMDAISQWRFTPATLNDVPVPVYMKITVSFVPHRP